MNVCCIWNNTVKGVIQSFINTAKEPVMIIEYKAPSVNITQDVLNKSCVITAHCVRYLLVSNGKDILLSIRLPKSYLMNS